MNLKVSSWGQNNRGEQGQRNLGSWGHTAGVDLTIIQLLKIPKTILCYDKKAMDLEKWEMNMW